MKAAVATVEEHPLAEEVRTAYLSTYTTSALRGRLAHYEREAFYENDDDTREALRAECQRTRFEISWREKIGLRGPKEKP